jgi:hypothetical protein
VTVAETWQETGISVPAVYPKFSYNINLMPQHFAAFAELCLRSTEYDTTATTRDD